VFALSRVDSLSVRQAVAAASEGDSVISTRAQSAPELTTPDSSAPLLHREPAAAHNATLKRADPSLITPVVAEGKTELGEGLFVVRNGRVVTVVFDTKGKRTRRRDKFERVVRQTLPKVFGENAREALAQIPVGELMEPTAQVTELTERGLRFALEGGASLALFPETRPARDGPLVVSYRATPLN
jgi:hypothetical protein